MTDQLKPSKKRRVTKMVVGIGLVLVLAAGGTAAWALNRYVIDHVEIADVAAFEAAASTAIVPTLIPVSTSTSATPKPASASTTTATIVLPTVAQSTIAAAPATTENSYTNGATSIAIKKVVSGTGTDVLTYFVADVVLGDATELRSAFAQNKFGSNIVADTSTIAEANNAVFAINGDYYGFRQSGIVIRNGVVFRDVGARQGLAFYRDGSMKLYDEKATSGAELVAAGVWNTLSFGPGLVDGGEVVPGIDKVQIDTNVGNHSIQGNQPRTGLGVIDNNHLVFVVVDGRSKGYSRGVSVLEFAAIFKELGASVAYNLDGGGSSTMYFNGALVNSPLGKGNERGTSDILYIGGSAATSSS